MSLLVINRVLTAALEGTYGSDAAPTGADAVQFSNFNWNPEGLRKVARNIYRNDITALKSKYGGMLRGFSFDVELKHSGTIDVAPEYGPILQSCALVETITGATDVVYTRQTDPNAQDSCTIYFYAGDTLRYVMTGCRGNAVFSHVTGENPKVTFTMVGHSNTPTDVSAVTPTLDTTEPKGLIGVTCTVGAFTPSFEQFSIDLGNTIAQPASMTDPDGFGELRISMSKITGSIDPLLTSVAEYDWENELRSDTDVAFAFGPHGSGSGDQYAIALPNIGWTNLGPGEREGLDTHDMEFEGEAVAGTDITLTFD